MVKRMYLITVVGDNNKEYQFTLVTFYNAQTMLSRVGEIMKGKCRSIEVNDITGQEQEYKQEIEESIKVASIIELQMAMEEIRWN